MGSAVCPVTAAIIFFGVFIRNREEVVFRFHGLVESRVKYSDGWNVRQGILECVEAREMRGSVKRVQRGKHFDFGFGVFVEVRRVGEIFSALDNAVPHRGNFV